MEPWKTGGNEWEVTAPLFHAVGQADLDNKRYQHSQISVPRGIQFEAQLGAVLALCETFVLELNRSRRRGFIRDVHNA